MIPDEVGNEVLCDFKTKYKLHLVNSECNNLSVQNEIIFRIESDQMFDNENIQCEVPGSERNILDLKNVEDLYTPSKYLFYIFTGIIHNMKPMS